MKPRHCCWVLLAGLSLCMTACDRTDQLVHTEPGTGKTKAVSAKLSALNVIAGCKLAYQSLATYQDEGYVRLRYALNGEATEDRAPLSVAFERPGKLGIRAYGVQAGPKSERWYLKLTDSDRSAVAGQIISRALPAKADLGWLLSDPAITDELSAGLAGFPPQLDVLLAPEPMRGLINESAMLSLDTPEKIDELTCHVVRVNRAGAIYRLWIDQNSMLLRRVQIPNANLTPEMLADASVSNVQLTIELSNIKTNTDIDWKRFDVALDPAAKLVSRFVPAPPPLPTDRLGMQVPGFILRNVDGQVVFKTVDAAPINVLIWLADHPACRAAAEQLSQIAAVIENGELKRHVRFVCVWAEPEPPRDCSFAELMSTWKLPGVLAVDQEAIGRDLFNVREAPTMVVLDANNQMQIFEERSNPYLVQLLPDLLRRLAGGENLAEEVKRTFEIERQRHTAELLMSASVDANRQNFNATQAYPSRYFNLAKTDYSMPLAVDSQVVALNVDDAQMIWTLTTDGRLRKEDPSHQTIASYRTPWKIAAENPTRLEVSPGGQFVAIYQARARKIRMFDTLIEQTREVDLTERESVVDFGWVTLAGAKTPRLAVVTSESETKLLDPNNHEQLSGRCPADPLAIVSYGGHDAQIGGMVVLADRSVENLLVSPDAAYQTPKEIGRPASHRGTVGAKTDTGDTKQLPKRLAFQPAAGPWKRVGVGEDSVVLARGWIAQDEPAVFLLDSRLQQQWHYRMPLTTANDSLQFSTASIDPTTGQPLWALCHTSQTIHLLRGDGIVTDHFHVDAPVRGLGLVPEGNQLVLYVAHPQVVTKYTVGTKAH